MTVKYEVLLKHGWAVDPASGLDGLVDVAIAEGRIVEIGPDLDPTRATDVLDVARRHVVPGIIDLHTHVSEWLGGRFGHKMMARVGVTTALDMAGPVDGVLRSLRDYGTGLNIACIEGIRPGVNVRNNNPDRAELETMLAHALRGGAIGLKIRGGHMPLTPEATARAIAVANAHQAYAAIHAGTTERGSNIDGFLQAVELAAGHALHIAHLNNYCRGAIRPLIQEAEEAIAALIAHPNIRSESYLSLLNGTSAKCANGAPESLLARECLTLGGFPPTEAGFEAAIQAGWAQINMEAAGEMVLGTGRSAVEYWRARATDTPVSFQVHPPEPPFRLAVARRPGGQFAVDCISTDAGGGIPRNVIVEMGLCLVGLQAITIADFVRKTSTNPARVLGLRNKGHLSVGADADITVLDVPRHRALLSLSNGKMVMYRGQVVGRGGQMITTAAGEAAVRAAGLTPLVVSLADSGFYRGV